jgi:hypothetical protein
MMETRRYGDGYSNFVGIKCGWCKVEEWHPAKNGGWAMRIFRVNGWKVGSKDNQHRCPVCFGRVINARRKPDNPAIPADVGKIIKVKLKEAHVKEALLGSSVLNRFPEKPDREPVPLPQPIVAATPPEPPTPVPEPAPAYVIAVRGSQSRPGVSVHPNRHNARQAGTRNTGSVDGLEFFTVPSPPDAPPGWMWKLANTVTDEERVAWRESRRYGPKPTKRRPGSLLGPKPTIPETQKEEPTMTAEVTTLRKDPMPTPSLIEPADRQPTRDERGLIHDELTKVYDNVDQRYRGRDSDRVVAERLDLPRIFVTDIRAMFFGDHDRNADSEAKKAGLEELVKVAQAAGTRLIEMAAEAETIEQRLKAALKKLEG